MAKRKNQVPKEETKKAKFKRVVEPRVRKAIRAIKLVANCAGSAYEYNAEQVSHIVTILTKEVNQVSAVYQGEAIKDADFNLD